MTHTLAPVIALDLIVIGVFICYTAKMVRRKALPA